MSERSFRVWYSSSAKDTQSYIHVADVEEAKEEIRKRTEEDLKTGIVWTAMGLEVFEDDEWTEYYDEQGRDIDQIMTEEENETFNNC